MLRKQQKIFVVITQNSVTDSAHKICVRVTQKNMSVVGSIADLKTKDPEDNYYVTFVLSFLKKISNMRIHVLYVLISHVNLCNCIVLVSVVQLVRTQIFVFTQFFLSTPKKIYGYGNT
jgi:hypothetical protein